MENASIRLRDLLTLILVLSPVIWLLGGGIAMCCMYERGEQIDALGYWIIAIMLAPYLLLCLLSPFWHDEEESDEE